MIGASDRQTAREVATRSAAVNSRVMLETRCAELNWLEPLGRAFLEMDRQFLPLPQVVKMLGASAVWDSTAGRPVPPESFVLSADDLLPDYDIRATAMSRRQVDTGTKLLCVMTAMQVLGAIPPVAAAVNWVALVRAALPLLGIGNPDRMMNTEEQALAHLALFGKGGKGISGIASLGSVGEEQAAQAQQGQPMNPMMMG